MDSEMQRAGTMNRHESSCNQTKIEFPSTFFCWMLAYKDIARRNARKKNQLISYVWGLNWNLKSFRMWFSKLERYEQMKCRCSFILFHYIRTYVCNIYWSRASHYNKYTQYIWKSWRMRLYFITAHHAVNGHCKFRMWNDIEHAWALRRKKN